MWETSNCLKIALRERNTKALVPRGQRRLLIIRRGRARNRKAGAITHRCTCICPGRVRRQWPGSTRTFGLAGRLVLDTTVEGTSAISTSHSCRTRVQEAVERKGAEIMHRDHQRRLQRMQHLDHAVEIERKIAVHRHHHHVDAADFVELLLRQRVVQMAEMGDAQIGHLEDEDRIAVPLGAAVPACGYWSARCARARPCR